MNTNSRRSFLGAAALAGAAASQPLDVFAQAVGDAPKSSMPSDLKITDIKCGYIRGLRKYAAEGRPFFE